MKYAEAGRYPMSIIIKKSAIKCWLKVIQSVDNKLIRLIHSKIKEFGLVAWLEILCKICHFNHALRIIILK